MTIRGITETKEVSMSISKRNFASDKVTIVMNKAAAEQSATNSYLYLTSIENINARVTIISVALGMDVTSNV